MSEVMQGVAEIAFTNWRQNGKMVVRKSAEMKIWTENIVWWRIACVEVILDTSKVNRKELTVNDSWEVWIKIKTSLRVAFLNSLEGFRKKWCARVTCRVQVQTENVFFGISWETLCKVIVSIKDNILPKKSEWGQLARQRRWPPSKSAKQSSRWKISGNPQTKYITQRQISIDDTF